MNAFTTEDLETAEDQQVTLDRPAPSSGCQPMSSTLSNQQETFIQEHFSTKLEDPQTGRWIRSWRAEG